MINDAWASISSNGPTADILSCNKPPRNADIENEVTEKAISDDFIEILNAFFPATVPVHTVDPNGIAWGDLRGVKYKEGEMAYRLWQSVVASFHKNNTKRNFPAKNLGRGGPGAAVALGLAKYHVDPGSALRQGDPESVYFDRIVTRMKTGLEPGAILQIWNKNEDYEKIKSLSVPEVNGEYPLGDDLHWGHSPIFQEYIINSVSGEVEGIKVIDQNGVKDCKIIGTPLNHRMNWGNLTPEIWVAANWEE